MVCGSKNPQPICIARRKRIPVAKIRFSIDRIAREIAYPRGDILKPCPKCPPGLPQLCVHYRSVCRDCDSATTNTYKVNQRKLLQHSTAVFEILDSALLQASPPLLKRIGTTAWVDVFVVWHTGHIYWIVCTSPSSFPYASITYPSSLQKFLHVKTRAGQVKAKHYPVVHADVGYVCTALLRKRYPKRDINRFLFANDIGELWNLEEKE